MTCDQTEPLLDALADSELSPWQTWRVRNHVAGCSACAAHLADIQHLDASVHIWRDRSAPAELGVQIAAALPSDAPRIAPRSFPLRRASVGFAILAVALAVFLWFLPGQPGQPTIAFADVEKAMAQFETVSWTTTGHTRFVGRTGHASQTNSSKRTWLRYKPAAIATFQQPNGYLGGVWGLEDRRGQMTRYDYDNFYQVHKANEDADMKQLVKQQIQSLTQPPTETIQSVPSKATRIQTASLQGHETTLNGHTQILFVRNYNYATTPTHVPAKMLHVSENTWVDPTTHRVTQIEIDNVGGSMGPGWHSSLVKSDFHYNETAPPGVFDWSPPAGAKVKRF